MEYIDTSIIVALLAREPAAERVSAWLREQTPGSLHVSGWTMTEFSSALSLKLRTGQIDIEQKSTALAAFNRLVSRSLVVLPVASPDFHAAARLCDRSELGLRAGDSLHIAIAVRSGLPIVTLDKVMAAACSAIAHPAQFI
ncbi:type II toxin-antitoxin system VapC family toxin [Rhizobium sp. WL3]|uniref:type II toxin-antitoxin system VapC family toxin n=1 Tax=Rhizobium sp. WL3 TaxID=2603277 RepID=UPI0011C1FD74|nr:type II toxin-antitoxin system VapC family toxin [Rhizobium sp. WL3]QEE44388.1 type II toxin-antitoxin system VapC family toxin [Rhizobium sp. WL3]